MSLPEEAAPAAKPFDNLSTLDIVVQIADSQEAIKDEKAHIARLNDELQERMGTQVAAAYIAEGKEHGVVNLGLIAVPSPHIACSTCGGLPPNHQNVEHVCVKADIKRTVKWDSDKLQAIAATMSWDAVQVLFRINFAVPEATYKSTLDKTLKAKLEDARTTKLASPKLTITAPELK